MTMMEWRRSGVTFGRSLLRAGDGGWSDDVDLERIRIPFDELADDRIGIETDRFRVGAHKGFSEDAGRPARHIVALESFEKATLILVPSAIDLSAICRRSRS